jgi:hypothetical protein
MNSLNFKKYKSCCDCPNLSYPGRLGTKGSSSNNGCSIRLRELNNAKKPSPTKLTGSQISRENYIRRRVAVIKQISNCLPDGKRFKNDGCNKQYAYGPIFGIGKKPRSGGGCNNIYSSNGGSGSDVTKWKRLYGGPRQLFNTSSCKYGCNQKIKASGIVKTPVSSGFHKL